MLNTVISEHIRVHTQDQSLLNAVDQDNTTLLQNSKTTLQETSYEPQNAKQAEDMQAFMKMHSFAVAFANYPYDNFQEEQNIINFLLRKVILMRELPLVKATKNLTFIRDI